MRSVVNAHYGPPDALRIEDVPRPVPGDDGVLVRVRAASINPLDLRVRGKPYILRLMFGLRKPSDTRLGRDVSGEVETVGNGVTRFQRGDEVFGTCIGAFAEYACAAESKLVVKPANVTFEQAAAVPVAGLTALQGLRDRGRLQAGQKVLINGAAGGVGTFAVQIAKALGGDVTGVCSTRNVELVRTLGADRVVDYTKEDFTRSGQRYDVIFDCIGNRPLFALRRLLNPNGIHVTVGAPAHGRWVGPVARMLSTLVFSKVVSRQFVMFLTRITTEDLSMMCELMESGRVTPVVDKTYALPQVAEAVEYLEGGHARGKVVLTV